MRRAEQQVAPELVLPAKSQPVPRPRSTNPKLQFEPAQDDEASQIAHLLTVECRRLNERSRKLIQGYKDL